MKRDRAGVVIVFAGFAVAVLAFRGVWGNAFHALIGRKDSGGTTAGGGAVPSGSLASASQVKLSPGSFALEYPTPAAGARPGSAPTPAAGPSYVPHPVQIGGHTYMGQLTEGGKGETEYFSQPGQIAALGGGTFVKPGHYTRLKMPGQNTIWIYAGT